LALFVTYLRSWKWLICLLEFRINLKKNLIAQIMMLFICWKNIKMQWNDEKNENENECEFRVVKRDKNKITSHCNVAFFKVTSWKIFVNFSSRIWSTFKLQNFFLKKLIQHENDWKSKKDARDVWRAIDENSLNR
jgi:hypothetical protein